MGRKQDSLILEKRTKHVRVYESVCLERGIHIGVNQKKEMLLCQN